MDTELSPTTAPDNYSVGTGEIAGNIGMEKIDVSALGISSSEPDQATIGSPYRINAPYTAQPE